MGGLLARIHVSILSDEWIGEPVVRCGWHRRRSRLSRIGHATEDRYREQVRL